MMMGLDEQLANLKTSGSLVLYEASLAEVEQHMLTAKELLADSQRE